MLAYILLFISLCIIFFLCFPYQLKINKLEIKIIGLIITLLIFILSLFLWLFFDNSSILPQFILNLTWLTNYNLNIILGVDGYSLFLILLTTFTIPICILINWYCKPIINKIFILVILIIELFLIIAFSSFDLFLFFIVFEGILIPIFILVGNWGKRLQKIKANYYFFIYTFFSSIFLLFAILLIYNEFGTTNYYILTTYILPIHLQYIIWLCLFIPFIVKIPVLPFHIWLPEAHVEAPTSGSIILAALLLKLGLYGILRFLIPICPDANLYFLPLSCTLILISLFYTSLTTLRQTDLKRIIAYSSITHINFATLGLLVFNYQSVQGTIVIIIAHGFVSTALFSLIGILYERTHTRLIDYYSGLAIVIPIFGFFLFFFCFANFGLPLTFNFIGEFLILLGIIQQSFNLLIIIIIGIFFSLIYSIWLFNRVAFGNLKLNYIQNYIDLIRFEFYLLLPLFFLTIYFGVIPNCILETLDSTIKFYLLSI